MLFSFLFLFQHRLIERKEEKKIFIRFFDRNLQANFEIIEKVFSKYSLRNFRSMSQSASVGETKTTTDELDGSSDLADEERTLSVANDDKGECLVGFLRVFLYCSSLMTIN